MNIFLHIGYHKTGSSFLQSMFVKNTNYLKNLGFYYPSSSLDGEAINDKISAGNAQVLSEALINRNKLGVKRIISSWIHEANERNCQTLILSNEGLFHAFSSMGVNSLFKEVILELQILEVRGLLFVREPVSHILSLYKHRGKVGDISYFKNWVNTDYKTLGLTSKFIQNCKESIVDWKISRYESNSSVMVKTTFGDWLGIKSPPFDVQRRVNESLSLSEIFVLSNLYEQGFEFKVLDLQEQFAKIPRASKGKESLLKHFYSSQANPFIQKSISVLEKLNEFLPKNKRFDLEVYQNSKNETDAPVICLSDQQLRAIIMVCTNHINLKYRVKIWKRNFNRRWLK